MELSYTKGQPPRLTLQIYDVETEEVILTIDDLNWMNVGQMFTDYYVDQLMKQKFGADSLPKSILVSVDATYNLFKK